MSKTLYRVAKKYSTTLNKNAFSLDEGDTNRHIDLIRDAIASQNKELDEDITNPSNYPEEEPYDSEEFNNTVESYTRYVLKKKAAEYESDALFEDEDEDEDDNPFGDEEDSDLDFDAILKELGEDGNEPESSEEFTEPSDDDEDEDEETILDDDLEDDYMKTMSAYKRRFCKSS